MPRSPERPDRPFTLPMTLIDIRKAVAAWWRKSSLWNRAYTLVGVLGLGIIALDLLGVDVVDALVKRIQPQGTLGVTKIEYNFTPYTIEYLLNERVRGQITSIEDGGATGGGFICCYKPDHANEPLHIRWRYVSGEYSGVNSGFHYEAVLRHPEVPPDADAFTIRFYPGGRVALRYTDKPESGGFGNVDPALPGEGWVEGQGRELPGLSIHRNNM